MNWNQLDLRGLLLVRLLLLLPAPVRSLRGDMSLFAGEGRGGERLRLRGGVPLRRGLASCRPPPVSRLLAGERGRPPPPLLLLLLLPGVV
ncbi:MAG: hypothetical protein AAFS07_19540, partial [Pseudomonadota bacterium]